MLEYANNATVYACLLDASCAFDRVNFGKLFNRLLDRGLPAIITRVLLDCYTRQKVLTKWNNTVSNNFTTANGVRQGAILSPVLFCMYIDALLKQLGEYKYGCRIRHMFMGAFSYADDISLLSPSIHGLL